MKTKEKRHKLKSSSEFVSINGFEWVSNPCSLTTQPSQLCVDSGMLTYKNVNLRHRYSRQFWLTFLQAFNNCDCGKQIKRRRIKLPCKPFLWHSHQTSSGTLGLSGAIESLLDQINLCQIELDQLLETETKGAIVRNRAK